jgi:uncharacterized protein
MASEQSLYLDTSALVKLYVQEAETAELSAFVRRFRRPLPYTSLHELELTHALERRRRERALTAADANRVRKLVEEDLRLGVLVRPEITWPVVFARAIQLLRHHAGLRSLDALHLGCALELAPHRFVTYDSKQGVAAAAEQLSVWPRGGLTSA